MRSYPENIMAVTKSDLLEAINKLAVTFVMSSFEFCTFLKLIL